MTPSGGSWGEEQEQKEYLLRPDPARPDFIFLDEDFAICVQTWPAATPVWLDYGPSQRLFDGLAGLAPGLGFGACRSSLEGCHLPAAPTSALDPASHRTRVLRHEEAADTDAWSCFGPGRRVSP